MSTKIALLTAASGGVIWYLTGFSPFGGGTTSEDPKITKESTLFCLRSGYCAVPHPSKKFLNPDPEKQYLSFGAGEDSGFISPFTVGIGDGVGGWSRYPGANVALFSRLLMHHCKEYTKKGVNKHYHTDSNSFLIDAVRDALYKIDESVIGSSTCVLVNYDPYENAFQTSNIGDSNYIIIRDGKRVHRGEITQVRFNFPNQVGTRGHDPSCAKLETVEAHEGDIVVLGSDGLWDNLFENEVVNAVNLHMEGQICKSQDAAKQVVMDTLESYKKEDRESPFSRDAKAQGQFFQGPKVDDLCVIVSQLLTKLEKSKL